MRIIVFCNHSIPSNIPQRFSSQQVILKGIPDNVIALKSPLLSQDVTSITIPSSVTYLCDDCFKEYQELRSITIPTTVKCIGKHLIDGCSSLTELNYEGDWNNIVVSYNDHLRYKSNGLIFNNIEYTYDDKIKYGSNIPSIVHSLNCSYYDKSNEIIHIPTHINSLDNHMKNAFKHCISLQSINIPTSVIEIEKYAFEGCYSLSTITLPTPLPTLGKKCFKGCMTLKIEDTEAQQYI
ncbi:hypothetical protein QTN25_009068 [Entamoeba marina]